jgi:hypothetical protein
VRQAKLADFHFGSEIGIGAGTTDMLEVEGTIAGLLGWLLVRGCINITASAIICLGYSSMKNGSCFLVAIFVLLAFGPLLVHAQTTTFTSTANCNLSAPAFCETFNEGPSVNNGRGGDLDHTKWTASRLSGEISNSGQGALNPQLVAPIPACRSTFTQTNVFSPNDTLICDPSGSKTAQLMTAVAIQNYGTNDYMILQPFDFSGRTGKIDFDVDAVSTTLGGYPEINITDQPVPGVTYRENNNTEVGSIPQNAIIVKFANVCNNNTSAGPLDVMVYNNYVGTVLTPTVDFNTAGCVQTTIGSLNHFEIQLSQTQISVYGSDFSTDNVTFPNSKLLYQATINLPFTQGYVHIAGRNHASIKYGVGPDVIFHWDNIGFDGPVIPALTAYEIPDNTTPGASADSAGVAAQNLGYLLLDGTTGKAPGMYSPTNLINSLSFQNVNLSGVASAALTFNGWFNAGGAVPPNTTWGISYSLNGGPFTTVSLTATQIASMLNNTGGFYQGFFTPVINVPLSVLVQGTNTIQFLPVNSPMDNPPVVTNIDLLLNSGPASHDFNGDGKSDIAWRDGSGDVALWLMDGTTVLSSGGVAGVPTTWSVVGQRDFNGDGMADLLWRDTSGDTAMWFMNGTTVASTANVGNIPTNWTVVGVADFNGDGLGDILWTVGSGNYAVWLMSGATAMSAAGLGNVPTNWNVVGTGDFNGDGMSDILWQDNLGNTAIWFMNGTMVASSAGLGNIPTNWSVVGTGDFNGDGMADIVWRDKAGDTAIWLMNGAAVLSAGGLGNVPTTWSIALIGDYNGDGMSDLLWRDSSGNTSMWFMNGVTVSSAGIVGNIPTNWTVQATNAE